jgi:hypothetical protein
MRKPLLTAGVVVLLAASGVLAGSWPGDTGAQRTSDAAAANVASCSEDVGWTAEGAALLAFQAGNPSTVQGPASTTTVTPFAYESNPVNTSGPGVYTFEFGPLLPGFSWGSNPPGAAFLAPPDFQGSVSPVGSPEPPQVIAVSGQTYFQQEVDITGGPACTGLQLWMY